MSLSITLIGSDGSFSQVGITPPSIKYLAVDSDESIDPDDPSLMQELDDVESVCGFVVESGIVISLLVVGSVSILQA